MSEMLLYFTISDLRLPFSSPPTTRRVTVEVFDPASTREFKDFIASELYIRIQSVPHRKHYVSITTPNRLMLFRETIAVYSENRTEHINTQCGQNAEY
jgi:hypothetical protein